MENKETGSEKEGCCSSSGSCGCGGGGKHCCGGKAALVLVLLLIGGLIGFGVGHCGHHRGMGCPMYGGAPVMAPSK